MKLANTTTTREVLRLASELGSVEAVESASLAWARQAGFGEEEAHHLALVAREASANAVIHGNRCDGTKHVTATFALTGDALTIAIGDEGDGLDPTAIPDPLAPENLLRSSGRGVFLMRALMDEVHFRKLSPGTEITLVKHRTQATDNAG